VTLAELGNVLRGLRAMRRLTQAEAAGLASMTASRVGAIENGGDPRVSELWKLLDVYRVDKEATALLLSRWVVFEPLTIPAG